MVDSSMSGDSATEARVRAAELLSPLRAFVRGDGGDSMDTTVSDRRLDDAFTAVLDQVTQIFREHQGMADEVLRVYEHVGIVFDLTPRLLSLRSENEVVTLLVESLKTIFRETEFGVVDAENRALRAVDSDMETMPGWVVRAVNESLTERTVRVANEVDDSRDPLDRFPLPTDQALVAPLFAGDDAVCALVMLRARGTRGWESGDMLLMDSLSSFCGDVIRNFRLLGELQQVSMDTVRTLVSAVDQKDPYTSGHSNRVGYYAKLLATEIGFDFEALRALEWSALLHDVGKIGIRDSVLKKPGKLTQEEFEHIKEHPLRGYEVVRENPHMRDAVDGVLHHHERYDGKGYPVGLRGEEIPLQARIIQVADIFDALTTTRSYRDAFSWRKAMAILEEEEGTVVDPNLSQTFRALLLRMYERNPVAFGEIGSSVSTLHLADDPTSPTE